ncbi:MAG: CTP-dependent riboflavin kinase [Desulfurococcaceae archaeon]|nr:CTP-dependent riboflavin kinase [Desulfurococcaceae archaeon]
MMCTDMYYVVKGKVIDGVGEGAKYVRMYHHVIENVLRISPYPGTLNIQLEYLEAKKLKELLQKHSCRYYIPPPCRSCVHAYAWKAYIKRERILVPIYIVRPAKTVHGEDVVEILSELYLRGVLGLKTGDVVEIYVTSNCVEPCI